MSHTSFESSTLLVFSPIEDLEQRERWASVITNLGMQVFEPDQDASFTGYACALWKHGEGDEFSVTDFCEAVLSDFPEVTQETLDICITNAYGAQVFDEGGDYRVEDIQHVDPAFLLEVFEHLYTHDQSFKLLAVAETFIVSTHPNMFGGNWGGWHIYGKAFARSTSAADFDDDIASALHHAENDYGGKLQLVDGKVNFLAETLRSMWKSGHTPLDVLYVFTHTVHSDVTVEWDAFAADAELFNYYPSETEIGKYPDRSLVIQFRSGASMRRWNPSGDHWCWGYNKPKFWQSKDANPITPV